MNTVRFFGIVFLVLWCLSLIGCAEFLEDYQYNPASPLYQTSSGN